MFWFSRTSTRAHTHTHTLGNTAVANMQVICGVATSQLSRLLSPAPSPLFAATFLSNPPVLPPAPNLTRPAMTLIASLVFATCTKCLRYASLQTLTTFGRSVHDEGMMGDSSPPTWRNGSLLSLCVSNAVMQKVKGETVRGG